ncbi:hypothetical protein ACWGLF_45650 [Streptomyces puniciscabiei]
MGESRGGAAGHVRTAVPTAAQAVASAWQQQELLAHLADDSATAGVLVGWACLIVWPRTAD